MFQVLENKPYSAEDYMVDIDNERVSQIIQARLGFTYSAQAVKAWPLQTCAHIRTALKKAGFNAHVTYWATSDLIEVCAEDSSGDDIAPVRYRASGETELEAYCSLLLVVKEFA